MTKGKFQQRIQKCSCKAADGLTFALFYDFHKLGFFKTKGVNRCVCSALWIVMSHFRHELSLWLKHKDKVISCSFICVNSANGFAKDSIAATFTVPFVLLSLQRDFSFSSAVRSHFSRGFDVFARKNEHFNGT